MKLKAPDHATWLTLALFVVAVFVVNAWRTADMPEVAPDFNGVLADGSPVSLAAFRAQHPGRAVALHFWADWCPVCRTEQHSISSLLADQPVLTIAMQSGNSAQVGTVLRERGLAWPTVVDESGEISRAWGVPAVPAFIVLDADGRVRAAEIGYTSEIGMRVRLWLAGRN